MNHIYIKDLLSQPKIDTLKLVSPPHVVTCQLLPTNKSCKWENKSPGFSQSCVANWKLNGDNQDTVHTVHSSNNVIISQQ